MQELKEIGDLAVNYGPFVAVIGLLFRSNVNKDRIIEQMSLQLLKAALAQKDTAQVVKETIERREG
ncbi:hypothetical protein [Novosphingobium sp. ZW T3_23]|uniref:hypothetical protein n=1 Tax=Novosphingobium sp. ZW T3_23 TaxID=3378084 RepID=UPI0038534BEF